MRCRKARPGCRIRGCQRSVTFKIVRHFDYSHPDFYKQNNFIVHKWLFPPSCDGYDTLSEAQHPISKKAKIISRESPRLDGAGTKRFFGPASLRPPPPAPEMNIILNKILMKSPVSDHKHVTH